jgi:hypothetical protein
VTDRLLAADSDRAAQSIRMVTTVETYVACDYDFSDFPGWVFVTLRICLILLVDALVILQINRATFDDDVTAAV